MALPTLPSLAQLKPRERFLAAGSALVLLVVVMDQLLLSSWLGQVQQVKQEIQRLEGDLKHQARLLARKEYILAKLDAYERYQLPPLSHELQMASLLKDIAGLAEASHIVLQGIKPLPIETDALSTRYPLDVKFDCTLEEWADFLVRIESSTALYQIVRASLAAHDEAPDLLRASLRVVSTIMRPSAAAQPHGEAEE